MDPADTYLLTWLPTSQPMVQTGLLQSNRLEKYNSPSHGLHRQYYSTFITDRRQHSSQISSNAVLCHHRYHLRQYFFSINLMIKFKKILTWTKLNRVPFWNSGRYLIAGCRWEFVHCKTWSCSSFSISNLQLILHVFVYLSIMPWFWWVCPNLLHEKNGLSRTMKRMVELSRTYYYALRWETTN
jgi:hypothetical protein